MRAHGAVHPAEIRVVGADVRCDAARTRCRRRARADDGDVRRHPGDRGGHRDRHDVDAPRRGPRMTGRSATRSAGSCSAAPSPIALAVVLAAWGARSVRASRGQRCGRGVAARNRPTCWRRCHASSEPADRHRSAASGTLYLGDSVMLGAGPGCSARPVASTRWRAGSRTPGMSIVQRLARQHRLPGTLVVGLGTNGQFPRYICDGLTVRSEPQGRLYPADGARASFVDCRRQPRDHATARVATTTCR